MINHTRYPKGLITADMPQDIKDSVLLRYEKLNLNRGFPYFGILSQNVELENWQLETIEFLNYVCGVKNYSISGSIAFRYYGFIDRKPKDVDIEVYGVKNVDTVRQSFIDDGWKKCKDYDNEDKNLSPRSSSAVHYRLEKNGNTVYFFRVS